MNRWTEDPFYPELRQAALAEEIRRAERSRADRAQRRQRRRARWRALTGRSDLTA